MPRPSSFHGRLAGRSAIVTGAGSQGDGVGTGKAIAFHFACEGAKVCLVDIDADRVEATRAMIAEAGRDAIAVTGDVTDADACERIVAEATARNGPVDILVNNVGVGIGGGPVETSDPAMWDRLMTLNVKSAMLMARAALPHFAQRGGAIVNIVSVAGLRAIGDGGAYGPSKAALIAFTAELASLYGRRGIRANAIAPGHIVTPMVAQYLRETGLGELRRRIAPLGIDGDAWDIAAAALFLASDESRFITGICLPVDGGLLVSMPTRSYELGGTP